MTIERQIEILNNMRNDVYENSEEDQALYYAIRAIEALEQPEIIRCKDCKWKNRHNCTRAVEVFIDDDKYCAWAERRTDEIN